MLNPTSPKLVQTIALTQEAAPEPALSQDEVTFQKRRLVEYSPVNEMYGHSEGPPEMQSY